MEVDRNGLEVLGRDDCLRLLALATLGRIGFTSGALPTVLPVSFHLDGERILVRTGRGSKLDAALQNVLLLPSRSTSSIRSITRVGASP